MEPKEEGSQSENKHDNKDNPLSLRHSPESREDEIKKIGIIQHLTRLGEKLLDLYNTDELLEEEKEDIYQQYLYVLHKDIEMIDNQKKGYEEELPSNVLNITKPIDDNMLKVMNQCLSVINDYVAFVEEEPNTELFSNAFETLKETSYLLDETEDMLKVVLQSADTTGGIIGEA